MNEATLADLANQYHLLSSYIGSGCWRDDWRRASLELRWRMEKELGVVQPPNWPEHSEGHFGLDENAYLTWAKFVPVDYDKLLERNDTSLDHTNDLSASIVVRHGGVLLRAKCFALLPQDDKELLFACERLAVRFSEEIYSKC